MGAIHGPLHPQRVVHGELMRSPGQFLLERARHQRMAQRDSAFRFALRSLTPGANPTLSVDGLCVTLSTKLGDALSPGTESYWAIVRTRKLGLRIALVCTHNRGYAHVLGPDLLGPVVVGLRRNLEVCYVTAVSSTDETMTRQLHSVGVV